MFSELSTSVSRRFFDGAFWGLFGSLFVSLSAFCITIVLIQLLGKELYGKFVLFQSTLGVVGLLSGFGIGVTATRYIAALRVSDKERLIGILELLSRFIFAFTLVVSSMYAYFSDNVSLELFGTTEYSRLIAISSLSVFFGTMDGYQKSILIGFEATKSFTIASFFAATVSFPILIILACYYDISGAVYGIVASSIINYIYSLKYSNAVLQENGMLLRKTFGIAEWRIILKFSLPALLASSIVAPAHWLCNLMLAREQLGFDQLAQLSIAMQWFGIVMFVPGALGRIVLPILTERLENANISSARRFLKLSVLTNALVALPVAFTLIIFSSQILDLYGQSFEGGVGTLRIAVATAALLAVQSPVGNLVAASSQMVLGILMNAGWAAIYLIFTHFFIGYGAFGVVAAMGIAYISHSIWTFLFAYKQLRINIG